MARRITKDNFKEAVLDSTLPVLVDFYSDSCIACKKLAPVLGELEDNYEGKLSVVKINTNFDSELSSEFGIMSNPTLILFVEGENVGKKVGISSYQELENWIVPHV